MFEKKYLLGPSDVDSNLDLKMSVFFLMMQDAATEHAEQLGIGKNKTMDIGRNWVITRTQVEVIKLPKYLDHVTIKTYPGDNLRIFFPRYFVLVDENDNPLIKASTCWAVIDSNNRKIVMDPFPNVMLPTEHYDWELEMPKKCALDDNLSFVETRNVRYSDIDLNGHLNNTRYVEYFVDTHPVTFYKENIIKNILINYEKEIRAGDEVSFYSNRENPECIVGKVNGNNSFIVNIKYEKR